MMAEESFVRLNETVSGVVSAMDRGRDEEARVEVVRNVGPLFSPQTQGSAQGQARTSRKHSSASIGAKPSRMFVWLGNNVVGEELPSREGTKIKFDKNSNGNAILTLLKREIPEIGRAR